MPSPDPRRWLILGVLCLSLLVVVVDNTVLNVAIPSLIRQLHVIDKRVGARVALAAGLLFMAAGFGVLATISPGDGYPKLVIALVVMGVGNVATYTYDNSDAKHSLAAFIGSTRNFQHWFRDPAGGGAFFNTSNAISIPIVNVIPWTAVINGLRSRRTNPNGSTGSDVCSAFRRSASALASSVKNSRSES